MISTLKRRIPCQQGQHILKNLKLNLLYHPQQIGLKATTVKQFHSSGNITKSFIYSRCSPQPISKIHSQIGKFNFSALSAISLSLSPPTQKRHFSSRIPRGGSGGGGRGLLGVLATGATILAAKAKYVLVALKLTKLAPLVSMLISTGAYAIFYGWPFAAGMVGLIFVHECGHLLVMLRYGMPFTPMVFLPFMGAFIGQTEPSKNAFQDAMIAFGGPVLGTVGALATSAAAVSMDSQLLYALADFGFMINLFNLLPIGMMDGGRIGDAISPYFGVAGLIGGGGLIYIGAIHNPIFYLIMLTGAYSTASRFFGWHAEEEAQKGRNYYDIGRGRQILVLFSYLGLIGGLLTAMSYNAQFKKPPKQLEFEKENPTAVSKQPWEVSDDEYFEKVFGKDD